MTDIFSLEEVCERLEGAKSILILTHTRPDADTLGSAFALRRLMGLMGKDCKVINDDTIPKRLRFISRAETIGVETLPQDFVPDLIVSVDVSSPELLGKYRETYADRVDLAIDHHAVGTRFANETYMNPLGACGEIIFDIYSEFEKKEKKYLDKEAAVYLYAAICSDTGSFKFESVDAATHRRAAALLECGIDHSSITRRLYDSKSLSQVNATKVALCALHFAADNRIAIINFTKKMREENNLTREDIDDIIVLTRTIEGVEIGIVIKQNDDDPTTFKVSMRSNRAADVSLLCAGFGGGGHKRAAGCTVIAENEILAEQKLLEPVIAEIKRLTEGGFLDEEEDF